MKHTFSCNIFKGYWDPLVLEYKGDDFQHTVQEPGTILNILPFINKYFLFKGAFLKN